VIDRTVSHYRIQQRIGGGGMGIVYRAMDVRLNRLVALKFLAPELTRDENAKRRFLHEAQAASALDHPNICPVYEIDETPEGQLFIAMPLLDGEPVRERVARGPLPVQEAFEIAFNVVQGLAHAHHAGIVHRDIKPGNVVITGEGYVKIVDFGLAKLRGRSRLTASDATLGTVAYMSPEQAGNDEVDHRADVWSVGVMLHEMLTGRLPFRGQIDQAMVYSILNEDPTPVAELRKDVPRECAAIVERCLQKDPDKRYQSAEALGAAIVAVAQKLGWESAIGSGAISSVVPVSPARRTRLPVRAVAATLAVALAAVAFYQVVLNREPAVFTTRLRVAVLPLERLGDSPSQDFVDGLSVEVARVGDAVARELPSAWVLPYRRVLADPPAHADAAADAFGVNRVVTGNVQPFGGRHRLNLALLDARTTAELAREHVAFDEASTGLAGALAGAVARLLGAPAEAAPADTTWPGGTYAAYLEGTGLLVRSRTPVEAERADATLSKAHRGDGDAVILESRARASHAAARDEPASPVLPSAITLAAAAVAADSTYARAHATRAAILSDMGDAEGAVEAYRQAVRFDREYVEAWEALAQLLLRLDRFDESEVSHRRLVALRPDYAEGHRSLGRFYKTMGKLEAAKAQYDTALVLAPKDWRALTNMGILCHALGEWRLAREYFERSFIVKPTCYTCANTGGLLYYEGRFQDSAKYYEWALDYCDSSDYGNWGNWAGSLYWTEGRRAEALEKYTRAIALAEQALAVQPGDVVVMAHLADYHAMAGNEAQAVAMVERLEERASDDVEVLYRLACAHAKLGDRARALHYSWNAVQRGYPRLGIEREPLFRDLVRDDRFRRMFDETAAGHDAQPR
jgi:serine/threonine-protein kinase